MNIKTGIEKSIEGGWEGTDEYGGEYEMKDYLHSKEKVLLDPKFWEAISEVIEWKSKPLIFMNYVLDGKTLEEAFDLATQ